MTSVQELSCIFCKESFEDKESLQIHFRKHGDPKFNQTAKTKLRVQNESPTSSDASKNDNEMVSCDVCTEAFPTISKAITHKHKMHPDYDAKYFCPWCGKLFTLKYLYKKHLESTHDTIGNEVTSCFHCDCCDVDFFVPSAMVYHNKLFHRQDRDMSSIGYSKKVKLLCQELVQIYYCPFCGEEYENKVNLNKHMADDHSDENQSPEDILRCPLCEAMFYHLDAYELHLTFHSSEDLYSEENEMIKQIVEFSLDTVPPLMEKLDNPPMVEENDDLNTMGIDQFLQLTMNKETEEEQADHTEKVKSKKHKKHKKSKKSITLDEFLNMNTDLFGEGLNIHGIEEVPTRVVTKQLKSKKDSILKNSHKNKVLPSDIDKLKKQGITIKMKSGKKIVPTNIQQPISAIPTPKKSNVISTSSKVLSKLMNQSNSQIKIVKKAAPSSPNIELNTNEGNNAITSKSEETHDVKDNKDFSEETEYKSADKINEDITSETDFDKIGEENDKKTEHNKEIKSKSPLTMEAMSNPFDIKASNVTSDSSNEINEADDFDTNRSNDSNQDFFTENPSSLTNNTNHDINFEERQTLNDFEESLVGTKISRTNTSENFYYESQNNKVNKKNDENNETITDQNDKTNNTLNAIKHLSHLITVKPVVQSKSSPKSKEGKTINHCNPDQVEKVHHEINYEDEKNNIKDNCSLPINKLEKQKEHSPKALNALRNISKHVTIKSLTPQVSSPQFDDKFSDDSDNPDTTDDTENRESAYKSVTNNIVGRKVLDSRKKTEAIMKNSQTESPIYGKSKKLIIKKPLENDSESNSGGENFKMNTSNADLLKRLTNVTAKPISSKMPIKQQLTAQTSEQSTNNKKENITERVINEEIEIFNIDDSDSDDHDKLEEDNEVKTTKLPVKSVSDTKDVKSIPKSSQALRNLGKNITVKSNTQTSITHSPFKDQENFSDQDKTFSDEDEDFDQNVERVNRSMNHFIDQNNKMLQSTLKNLGKHLTVKSRKFQNLPQIRKHVEKNSHEKISNNDTESDSDSAVGKVKITEITDHASEDDFLSDDECKNFVQSPNSNNTDAEDNLAEDENPQHFSDDDNYTHHAKVKMKSNENPSHSPIPTSSVRQTASIESDQSPLGNFKKFNKEITIRSLNDNKRTNRSTENEDGIASKDSDISNNVNKELSLKPCKQNISKFIKSENQPTSSTINENVGPSNQVSTVNKEVSVKTFQSQTVIEEITTTVTKTIRTVNQTVKQEVKNTNQVNANPTFKPHKIANFNPGKNTHNATAIRNPAPSIGTKVKNIAPSKSTTSGIRPTNQLVPVRPGLNQTKASNFRGPVIRNVTPSKLPPQNKVPCRALKISPQVKNQSLKRLSQESVGQFSCFKKPKESLTDLQISRGEQEGETAMHISATQTRSDFTSTVKSMKGKALVTSTQMKSEMSASSHLSKLGNMSGLKIVKTSSKQSTQVEEKVESSGAKRTMEALQKLQMQGLLVKRPRTDDNEDNDFSNSGSENDDETYEK